MPPSAAMTAAAARQPGRVIFLALLAVPPPAEAARKAAAGLLPALAASDAPPLPAQPLVPEIVVPAAQAVPVAELGPPSRVQDGAAAFAAEGHQLCSHQLHEPPLTFINNWDDIDGLPFWYEGSGECEEGSTWTTVQMMDRNGKRMVKEITTTCHDGRCTSETLRDRDVAIPEALRKYGVLSNSGDNGIVSLVSRTSANGDYEEARFMTASVRGEYRKSEARVKKTAAQLRAEAAEAQRRARVETPVFTPSKAFVLAKPPSGTSPGSAEDPPGPNGVPAPSASMLAPHDLFANPRSV